MYELLLAKIQTTLEKIARLKQIESVPETKIDKYPAVFYKAESLENAFETGQENQAVYRFMLIVMVGVKQITAETAWNSILPKTLDAVIQQFDQDWNQGTIDGHRVTVRMESADPWEMSSEQDGLVAYAVLHLEVKLLTTN